MDDVVEELLRRKLPVPRRTGTWQTQIMAAADALRHLLVSQPAALYVYLRHPVVSPAAVVRMEMMLRVLRGAGFDEASSKEAYAAIQTYTIGFAARSVPVGMESRRGRRRCWPWSLPRSPRRLGSPEGCATCWRGSNRARSDLRSRPGWGYLCSSPLGAIAATPGSVFGQPAPTLRIPEVGPSLRPAATRPSLSPVGLGHEPPRLEGDRGRGARRGSCP